jgi:hypothetical protein
LKNEKIIPLLSHYYDSMLQEGRDSERQFNKKLNELIDRYSPSGSGRCLTEAEKNKVEKILDVPYKKMVVTDAIADVMGHYILKELQAEGYQKSPPETVTLNYEATFVEPEALKNK